MPNKFSQLEIFNLVKDLIFFHKNKYYKIIAISDASTPINEQTGKYIWLDVRADKLLFFDRLFKDNNNYYSQIQRGTFTGKFTEDFIIYQNLWDKYDYGILQEIPYPIQKIQKKKNPRLKFLE